MNEAPGASRRYRLVREIGRGSHATVYLAEDTSLGRDVALKVFTAAPGVDDAGIERRFRREVEALSMLDGPGVCRLFDAGIEDGRRFIALNYVQGETLDRSIAACQPGRPGSEIIGAIEDAARTLHAVHQRGVIHGDVKPGNLMRTHDGCVVLDFGLARIGGEGESDGGTLPYMAPEHFTNAGVGPASDVYSLGATLYEAIGGEPPFAAPTRQRLIAAIVEAEVPDVCARATGVPRDLAAIAERAVDKSPARRYRDPLEMADDLARFRRGEAVLARRLGAGARAWRVARRHPAAAALATFVTISLAIGLIAVLASRKEERGLLADAATQAEIARARSVEAAGHLDRFLRLSDVQRLAGLTRKSEVLWPPRLGVVPGLESALADARSLASRLDAHRTALAVLRKDARESGSWIDPVRHAGLTRELADLQSRGDEMASKLAARLAARVAEVRYEHDDAARTFEDQVLSRLVAGIAGMQDGDHRKGLIASLERRLAVARAVRTDTVDAHAEEWALALASIADRRQCPLYAGLVLAPQVGLVPLARNSESGLWEFLDPSAGCRPERDRTGRWVVGPETGMVFVLIPGATATIGARRPEPGEAASGPFVDPDAGDFEQPPRRVELAPFFLSKYEMTQGQWLRATGDNPSDCRPPRSRSGSGVTLAHPVESITWNDAMRVLGQVGWTLPTEAQWEHGCRAGTATRWWTGDDPRSLGGAENFADESFRRAFPNDYPNATPTDGIDDGYREHAPVGSFRPNAFGIHDAAGNVSEWCLDQRQGPGIVFAAGDGEMLGDPPTRWRAVRGGSFGLPFGRLRVCARAHRRSDEHFHGLGIRPCRQVD